MYRKINTRRIPKQKVKTKQQANTLKALFLEFEGSTWQLYFREIAIDRVTSRQYMSQNRGCLFNFSEEEQTRGEIIEIESFTFCFILLPDCHNLKSFSIFI